MSAWIEVEPRVLRRAIRRHRGLVTLTGPHADCDALPREDLRRYVDDEDLPADLPAHVILVARGAADPARLALHARAHLAIDALALDAAALRERAHRIGLPQMDELRATLRSIGHLRSQASAGELYAEIAATWLELSTHAPAEVGRLFPVELAPIVGPDLAPLPIPAGVPDGAPGHAPPSVAREPDAGLLAAADRARRRGNHARAAILAHRGGAPATDVLADLALIAGAGRGDALLPVVAAARRAHGTVAGRLLADLQRAALQRDRGHADVDVLGWALSRGRRPLIRPLPLAVHARVSRHLGRALHKLPRCALASADADRVRELVTEELRAVDARLRHELRPILEAALDAEGLRPASVPEAVARDKLVEELIDHVPRRGHVSLGHVRDALSSGDLKLSGTPRALLGVDRRLATSAPGVYRRGEIYLRALQWLSWGFSGTTLGRALTLHLLLPVLAALVIVEGLSHLIGPPIAWLFGVHPDLRSLPWVAATTAAVYALIHSAAARAATVAAARVAWRLVKAPFVLVAPAVRAIARSPVARAVLRYLVKPALVAAPCLLLERPAAWWVAGGVFVAAGLILNTPRVRRLQAVAADALVRAARHLGAHIVPSVVRLVLDLFRAIVDRIERAIYAVDEWLRFRPGEPRTLVVVGKGGLSVVWRALTYVLRICVYLFIEPWVNPIKHFPIVTVAAKVMLPFKIQMFKAMHGALASIVGTVVGGGLAGMAVLFLPGFAGFLAWEMKGNWRLYARNRPATLLPSSIGGHGETMARFLRPGFHSGTVPKHVSRLRRGKRPAEQREALARVEEDVHRFVDRELVALLRRARGLELELGPITLGWNRIHIELACPAVDATPVLVSFEDRSGQLVAGVRRRGFVEALPAAERTAWEDALAGLYRRAGVDLVRERIEVDLSGAPYDVRKGGLVVWTDDWRTETVQPVGPEDPIPWSRWIATWG